MRLSPTILIWLLSSIVCITTIVVSFEYVDLAIASYHVSFTGPLIAMGNSLGSTVILSGEAVTLVALTIVRLLRGNLPPFADALAVACLASICAYDIDSEILKVCFGVPNPFETIEGATHAINLWRGSQYSSFPSGHMALAGAFFGVFMKLYRISICPLSILLLWGCIFLVVGRWHFLSDVIAGTYLGIAIGLVAGELVKPRASVRVR